MLIEPIANNLKLLVYCIHNKTYQTEAHFSGTFKHNEGEGLKLPQKPALSWGKEVRVELGDVGAGPVSKPLSLNLCLVMKQIGLSRAGGGWCHPSLPPVGALSWKEEEGGKPMPYMLVKTFKQISKLLVF